MPTRRSARGLRSRGAPLNGRYTVFVEGPSDRALLAAWARRRSFRLSRALLRASVILGGRQPARAAEKIRGLRLEDPEATGLCVLDRDDPGLPEPLAEPGLDYFTWSRRHIESYLLVPEAIRRSLRLGDGDRRSVRALRDHVPEEEGDLRRIDAKRLLDRHGSLSRALARPLQPARIARAMRPEEFHPEIHQLLDRIALGLGLGPSPQPPETAPNSVSASDSERGILS